MAATETQSGDKSQLSNEVASASNTTSGSKSQDQVIFYSVASNETFSPQMLFLETPS